MAVKSYPYTIEGNYTFDSSKIEIDSGIVKLKEDLFNVYARWHLNESSGTDVPDSSGHSRDGTTVNMEDGDWVSGKLNNCLQFDGVDEYVNCGDIANFERTDAWSIEFWCKLTVKGSIMGRKDDTGSPYRGWELAIDINGRPTFILYNTYATNELVARIEFNLVDNTWHHVIITYDGSSNANGVKFYIDNDLKTTLVIKNTLSATIQVSKNFQIASVDGASIPVTGLLDEVVIYDKELIQSEVTFRYNSTAGRENWLYYSDKPTIEPTVLYDPAIVVSWDAFLETLGGGNEGSIGYNLYKVNKTNKYYWNGSAWVTGGSASNYNSQTVVNANIGTFDGSPDKIGFIAYLISDGEQKVELDENQITYTVNQAPLVNAGSNKSCKDNDTIAPFSDCSFSDPDGTVDHAYYKVDGEVDTWTEILQGGYGTLLEAVQAFTYQFSNTGTKTVRLQVEDNDGEKLEDSLEVNVQKFQVIFNIKDSQGNHIANIYFKPGDGSGYIQKHSPFTYGYDYDVSGYDIILDKGGYGIQIASVPSTDHTENFTLISLIDTSEFLDKMKRLLGLSQENYRIFNPVYDTRSNLTLATIKIYPTASDVDADTNAIASYSITATYNVKNQMTSYKVKKI